MLVDLYVHPLPPCPALHLHSASTPHVLAAPIHLCFALYEGEWSRDVTATTTRRFLVSRIEFGESVTLGNKRKVVAPRL